MNNHNGRPPKPPGQALKSMLHVRVIATDMKIIGKTASAAGMSVSEWCRAVLLKATESR